MTQSQYEQLHELMFNKQYKVFYAYTLIVACENGKLHFDNDTAKTYDAVPFEKLKFFQEIESPIK
jgi:hypothetical protein